MEIEFKDRTIRLSKELTVYDRLALSFSKVLRKHDVNHVFVSGYVAILFGRSRTSEDIDMLVKKMKFKDFSALWDDLRVDFYCHNAGSAETAYRDYLGKNIAVRFSKNKMVIPNVEFKWASNEQHARALAGRFTVLLPEGEIAISSLETQIAYKLRLGSEKDVEDARYLYELFKERLDQNMLRAELVYLNISTRRAGRDLGW